MIKRAVNSVNISMSVEVFLDNIDSIEADLSFQANEATRWKDEQKSAYITSIILGMSPSKFIFADVEECLNFARENDFKFDIDYYDKWYSKGTAYLNLDGNNRTTNLKDFRDGKCCIQSGDYLIDGMVYKIIKGLNDTYDTLPMAIKRRFLEASILVECYLDASREQLSQIFMRVNDGRPLNDAEKRNAMTSEIAKTIRSLATEYTPYFDNKDTKWFSKDQLNRRGVDDFIAGLCHIHFEGIETTISPQSLLSMYENGSVADIANGTFSRVFKDFVKVVKKKDLKAIPNRNSILDLFYIISSQKRDKKNFKNDDACEEFVRDFVVAVGELSNDTTAYTISPKSAPKTFDTMVGGRQASNNMYRNKLILSKMDLDKYFVTHSSARSASPFTKFKAAARDGFKTPEGKDIDMSKLHDGKTYHGGHITPHADGGDVLVDNIAIQEAKDNLKLGRKEIVYNENIS